MKRHSALIPFSHSHHEALLVALRLKKGGPSSPHDMLWPSEPKAQAEALIRFAEHELYPHFKSEEELLFPAAAGKSPELDKLITTLLADHSTFRQTLQSLALETDPALLPEQLRTFGEQLERHIRTEERELFPAIEQWMESGSILLS